MSTVVAAALLQTIAASQTLPVVTDVEAQPLRAQVTRLEQALRYIGSSLPDAVSKRLAVLRDAPPNRALTAAIQRMLDPLCLALVEINPEARAKVVRGPAAARLMQGGWRSFLVKVDNQAAVTARLTAVSPNAAPQQYRSTGSPRAKPENKLSPGQVTDRFLELAMFDQRPMSPRLSGLRLEYRILQVYTRDSGKREATLGFRAGPGSADIGFRDAIPILFDCERPVRVELGVVDSDGEPTTAGFVITDRIGRIYPLPARRRVRAGYPDFFFQRQVYRANNEHVDLPPGNYEFRVTRGPEYLPERRAVVVPDGPRGKPVRVDFALKRWIHPKELGWYSVDHHVHAAGCSHYESPEEGVRPPDMWRQALGEDLNVACVLTWGPCWYHQKQNFDGHVHPLSRGDYMMRYDVEVSGFPSSHAGHVCLLNLAEDDYPGAERIRGWPSWTLPVLQWAKKQGAVTGYAHSGLGLQPLRPTADLPNWVLPRYDGIGANEFIVTVTQDAVDFMSAGNTPLVWELNMWYHTLNTGFRARISGETDFPCIFDDRIGMGRSYVRIDGPLAWPKVVAGIAAGRSYVSDGRTHLLDFRVNDRSVGTEGSELRLDAPQTVKVRARVAALLAENQTPNGANIAGRPQHEPPFWHIERARLGQTRKVAVELVVNGLSVAATRIVADSTVRDVEFDARIERSSWVALRVLYSAHTNPVFVLVGGKPVRASRRSAVWCRQGVDQCWRMKAPRIRATEKQAARAAYDNARRVYDRRISECFDDR